MTSLSLAPIPPSIRARARLELQAHTATAPVGRIAAAGITALAGSLIADYLLASIGRAAFAVPPEFDKFDVGGYAVLTAVGVVAAVIGWPLTQRVTLSPRWLYLRAAVIITLTLLLPDVWLFTQPENPAGPVATLMVMHVAIAIVTYLAMTRLAPGRAIEHV